MIFELVVNDKVSVPACQFAINDHQQIAVLGIDFNDKTLDLGENEGIKYTKMGKVSEQSYIMNCWLRNSLVLLDWDWDVFPDPEAILIEKL